MEFYVRILLVFKQSAIKKTCNLLYFTWSVNEGNT